MTKTRQARHTPEFRQEAVRRVEGGQSIAAVARMLDVADRTLGTWVKAHRQGQPESVDSRPASAGRMDPGRPPADAARAKPDAIPPDLGSWQPDTARALPARGPHPGEASPFMSPSREADHGARAKRETGRDVIRVLLCDDHALIRRGIRDTLADADNIEVVGEAGDYGELRVLLRHTACDVLVLDINLPGRSGLDVLQVLKDEGSPLRVLVVSMYPEEQYAIRALTAGAYGYVNKAGDAQLIVSAVRTVAQGRRYVTPEIARLAVERLTTPVTSNSHEKLSDRELQTLIMIASGKRLSDIALELKLSPKTISVYRARVLEKLALSNNSELTVYAIRSGLV